MKIDWDKYFNFLEEYFEIFKPNFKRKKITGNQFKL